jgi:uncharacterized protein (DUF1778 family)
MSDEISTLIIPIPQPFQRNFGVHATSYQGAQRLTQRYSEADFQVIERQAARIGVTISAFIKESAVNMAKALEIQEKSHAQHNVRDRR